MECFVEYPAGILLQTKRRSFHENINYFSFLFRDNPGDRGTDTGRLRGRPSRGEAKDTLQQAHGLHHREHAGEARGSRPCRSRVDRSRLIGPSRGGNTGLVLEDNAGHKRGDRSPEELSGEEGRGLCDLRFQGWRSHPDHETGTPEKGVTVVGEFVLTRKDIGNEQKIAGLVDAVKAAAAGP